MDAKIRAAGERDIVLDFWRGISVLLVILHHQVYFHLSFFKDSYLVLSEQSRTFFEQILWAADKVLIEISERSGPFGVKIFFVISGYIITKLLIEEERKNGRISIWAFYIRRVFRILPAFLFYTFSVTVFASLGLIAFDFSELPNTLGFLCNTELNCSWFLVHTWSLSIEEQFYAFWPLLFLIIGSRYRVQFLSLLLGLLIILSCLGLFFSHGWLNNPISFASIAVGALYASSSCFREYMRKYGLFLTVSIIALLVLFHYTISFENEIVRQIYRSITPFLILSLIIGTYYFSRVISSKAFSAVSKIGLISYSLYLWQQVFSAPPEFYLRESFLDWSLLMVIFALISYLLIEKPAIKWARKHVSLAEK